MPIDCMLLISEKVLRRVGGSGLHAVRVVRSAGFRFLHVLPAACTRHPFRNLDLGD